MKNLLFAFFSLILFHPAIGQNPPCDCARELGFVSSQLKTVPSYKSQIKDEAVNQAFIDQLKSDIVSDPRIELHCLYYLQKYLTLVRDKHLSITTGKTTVDYQKFDYKVAGDLAAIAQQARQTDDELAGIYQLSDSDKVAVVPDKNESGKYLGVLLETKSEAWQPGMVKFVLRKTDAGIDGMFYEEDFTPRYRRIQPQNGRLYPNLWVKEAVANEYVINPYQVEGDLFQYKLLAKDTHYVRLGSFSGQNKNYAMAKKLAEEMVRNIESGKVLVDLRNNGGGGKRTSDFFLKFLRKNKKNLDVLVLQNYACASDCEQFLAKLKAQQTVKTFGENTYGAIAYGFGNRSSRQETTPCYQFSLNLTETKYEKYLENEVVGIAPDHYLNLKSDWVEQVLASDNAKD